MVDSPLWKLGDIQYIKHIDQSYPNRNFEGGLVKLFEGRPAVTKWFEELITRMW
jgi:hypothetical protein